MSELRWILIGGGLIVLGIIFLWGMRGRLLSIFSPENKKQKRSEQFDIGGSGQSLEDQLVNDIESLAVSKPEKGKLEPTINPIINESEIDDEKKINFGKPFFVKEEVLHEEDLQKSKIESGIDLKGMEPKISDLNEIAEQKEESTIPKQQTKEQPKEQPKEQANQVIVLYVRCPSGKMISGKQLKQSFINQGLKYGDMKIFHRMADDKNGVSTPLFGVANMVEPGTFNFEQMDQADTPGITVFLQLPAVTDDLSAFNDMFKTSVELAESIDGELVTQNKKPVTPAWLEQMRSLLAAS